MKRQSEVGWSLSDSKGVARAERNEGKEETGASSTSLGLDSSGHVHL